MSAELLMFLGGTSLFILTFYWVKKRELREKYAVAWIAVATIIFLIGLFPQVIMKLADFGRLSYPTIILMISLFAIYLFSFSVSVSLSRLHRRNIRLIQKIALLEERLKNIEKNG